MKTILIKCEIPDNITQNQIRVTYPGVLPGIAASFKVVEPETIQAISYNVTDQAGNKLIVVELEDILKLLQ